MAVLENWHITCEPMDLDVYPEWGEDEKEYLGKPKCYYIGHGNVIGSPKFRPDEYIHTSVIKQIEFDEDELRLRIHTQNSVYDCLISTCDYGMLPPLLLKSIPMLNADTMNAQRIFEDTQLYCASHFYQEIEDSINRTRFYSENLTPARPAPRYPTTITSVQRYRSFNTAQYYRIKYPKDRICVHNFASSRGLDCKIQTGNNSQEASLIRISTLFPVLARDNEWQLQYEHQRELGNRFYTDACLYTPKIIIFKSDDNKSSLLPKEEWTEVDVLTCAAPDLSHRSFFGSSTLSEDENSDVPECAEAGMDEHSLIDTEEPHEKLLAIHKRRGRQFLSVAAANGADIVILGAFGCGPFRNPPEVVAEAYADILPSFNGQFRYVLFAVNSSLLDIENYQAFVEVFEQSFAAKK